MGRVPHNKLDLNESEIQRLYLQENRSISEIARLFGCDHGTIKSRLVNLGVEIRSTHSFGKRLEKTCIWCGRTFQTYRKTQLWCSHKCRSQDKTSRLKKTCEICGRELIRRRGEQFSAFKRRRYCSNECWMRSDEYQSWCKKVSHSWFKPGENHPLWKGGRSYAFSREHPWNGQRILALERDDFRCMKCGYSILERRICVHHIKPFKQSEDNDLENLISLCLGCHRKIHANERRNGPCL